MANKKTNGKVRRKGEGHIFKRGKTYYLQYNVNGKRKVVSLRTNDEQLAKKKTREYLPVINANTREQIAAHVAEARKLKKRSTLMLAKSWECFLKNPSRPNSGKKTLALYCQKWKHFIDWISSNYPGEDRLSDISEDSIREYFSYIWNKGITQRTYNSYIQALKLVFRILAPEAMIEKNPVNIISKKTEEKQSRKEFTKQQVMAIFAAFDDKKLHLMHKNEMRLLFNICCWTGARGQDGCLMKWENVNFEKNLITYIPEKTRRKTGARMVFIPIHPQLREELEKALDWRKPDCPYILPEVSDRYMYNPSGIQKDSRKVFAHIGLKVSKDVKGMQRKLKVSQYSLHSFRHTFVSFCANAGVPLVVVQSIVGHGSPAMTRHYAHISQEAAQKAVESLPLLGNNDNSSIALKRKQLKELIDKLPEGKLNELINKVCK